MTEAWKSNPHYFCELCKVWMNDNPSARATHERGIKHQENMSRKLREMRQKADSEKRDQAAAVASMSSIEAKAKAQYDRDLKESQEAKKKLTGSWEKDEGSGHLYNAVHRYYFDSKTAMYYGGDPPAWTTAPNIPPEALYRPEAEKRDVKASTSGAGTAQKPSGLKAGLRYKGAHPLSNIGGYKMPVTGTIGGAKGVGSESQQQSSTVGAKRSREESDKAKPASSMSKAEQEALAKREAARARVQQRTMQAFGLR